MDLLGVNLAGAEFGSVGQAYGTGYTYPTDAEIDYYATEGMNVIRLPFLWERLQSSLNGPLNTAELARIDAVVNYATSKGLKVDLDVHNYGKYNGQLIGSSAVPTSAFANLWGQIAGHFASNPNVIYGLMNEPQVTDANSWLTSVNAAIGAIRSAGASQEVLVPGINWDGAWTWAGTPNATVIGTGVVDPLKNYAFEVHQYLDPDGSGTTNQVASDQTGVQRLQAATQWAEQTGNKLFLGEFGVATDHTSLSALNNMLAYMDQHADAWQGATYWAGGPWWWGSNIYGVEPNGLGTSTVTDQPQMAILKQYEDTTPAVTTTPTAPTTSAGTTAGGGGAPSTPAQGALILNLSEDAYLGDAQFTVAVDGTQIGGTQMVTALRSSGQSEAFTLSGNFSAGQHTVSVAFLNDAYAGTASTDRNLYVSSITLGGTTTVENVAQNSQGTSNYTVQAGAMSSTSTTPAGTTAGGGVAPSTPAQGALVLNLSEDAYLGDAQFTVAVDGTQIGGTQTVTTLRSSGHSQAFTLSGNFSAGQHTVSVAFLNDAYAGTASTDRNLYVSSITLGGTTTVENAAQDSQGTANYTVQAGGSAAQPVDPGPHVVSTAPTTIGAGTTVVIGTATPGLSGDKLSLVVTGTPPAGTLALSGSSILYTAPTTVAAGAVDHFTYQVKDQNGDMSAVTSGSPTLDPGPAAGAVSVIVGHNQTTDLTATLTSAVRPGLAGDALTLTGATGAQGATALANGRISYAAPATGSDGFVYTVSDQLGETARGKVSITVDPGPSAGTVSSGVKLGGSVDLSATILAAATPGLRGDQLSIQSTGTSGTLGTLARVNGDVVYTATGAGLASLSSGGTLSDSFGYVIADQYGDTAKGTATVAVTAPAAGITPPVVVTPIVVAPVVLTPPPAATTATVSQTFSGFGNQISEGNSSYAITTGSGSARVTLGDGNDTVAIDGYNNTVVAGDGNDTVTGGLGNSAITLGNGNNTVALPGYANQIKVGSGANTITPGGGSEQITAGAGTDVINLTGYSNAVTLNGSNATVSGSQGNDVIAVNGGHANLTESGWGNQVTLNGVTSANIADNGHALQLEIGSATQTDTITGFGTDAYGVIGIGTFAGYSTAADIVNALHTDGHGGTMLALGTTGSIDFINTPQPLLHASNFKIG